MNENRIKTRRQNHDQPTKTIPMASRTQAGQAHQGQYRSAGQSNSRQPELPPICRIRRILKMAWRSYGFRAKIVAGPSVEPEPFARTVCRSCGELISAPWGCRACANLSYHPQPAKELHRRPPLRPCRTSRAVLGADRIPDAGNGDKTEVLPWPQHVRRTSRNLPWRIKAIHLTSVSQ